MPLLNQRITELTENTTPAPDDYVPHVDRSDTTMAISGTTKFIKLSTLWKVLQTYVFAEDVGANDTYTATLTPAPDEYVAGQHYRFKANTANTGACTVNFNGLGAKTIKKAAGGITTDLADNDIRAGQWVDLVYDGTNMQMQSLLGNVPIKNIVFIFDGGGSVIPTGIHGDIGPIDFAGTIQSATLLADQSGDIVIDIWKDTYANFPATDADSITASAPPTISAADKSQDSTLTGWTTAIAAGDVLRFNVDSVATIQRATLALKVLAG